MDLSFIGTLVVGNVHICSGWHINCSAWAAQLWHLIEASFNTPWNVDLLFDIRAQIFAVQRQRRTQCQKLYADIVVVVIFIITPACSAR